MHFWLLWFFFLKYTISIIIGKLDVFILNSTNITFVGILEGPKTQYVLIGKNATFTCKSSGIEAHWALNHIPMTDSFLQQKQAFEDKGVIFIEDQTEHYNNITMIIHASAELNNTLIFCTVLGRDFSSDMSDEVQLIVFSTLRKFISIS